MKDNFPDPFERTSQNFPPLDINTLKQRKNMESNPDNYVTCVYPQNLLDDKTADLTDKLHSLHSGYVDFRNTAPTTDNKDTVDKTPKNTLWIGSDHREIMESGAKFPYDESINDYIIGLKMHYSKGRRRFIIDRKSVGQSCAREADHMTQILDAAEIAYNRDLIENDESIQRQFFLQDYGLNNASNLENGNIYSETKTKYLPTRDIQKPYDIILLNPVGGDTFKKPNEEELLSQKIMGFVSALSDDDRSSIRIPYNTIEKTNSADEVPDAEKGIREFANSFEKTHPELSCTVIQTRNAYKYQEHPAESSGYLLVTRYS